MPIDRNSAQYITGAIYKPTQTSAPGVWDLDDQANNIAKNLWPLPPQAVQRSLRFNSADSAYLNRTPANAGNRRTWTWSGWVKRSELVQTTEWNLFVCRPSAGAYTLFTIRHSSTANPNSLLFQDNNGMNLITSSVYRDVSAWLHIVLAVDTTNGTPANTVRIYVNGSLITSFSSSTYPTQNTEMQVNTTNAHGIGGYSFNTAEVFDGYMADINFIDGYPTGYDQNTFASTNIATLFGETDPQTGVWVPKRYTGTYGTNGFRLSFANNSSTTALGYDSSGQGNNWTANNFSVTPGTGNDSLLDVPSLYGTDTGLGGEVLGNYCTWNPNDKDANVTLANGNLDLTAYNQSAYATWPLYSGKWYYEITLIDPYNGTFGSYWGYHGLYGVQRSSASLNHATFTGIYCNTSNDGDVPGVYTLGSRTLVYRTFANNDILGFAVDIDARTMTIYKNGLILSANITIASSTPMYIGSALNGSAGDPGTVTANFGQRPFTYAAPSGYKALCTTNLPAPAIGQTAANQADNHFNVVTYNGSSSQQSITGLGFRPDLIWIKARSGADAANTGHEIYDAVRSSLSGITSARLASNSTAAENLALGTNGLLSYNADGFTIPATTNYGINSSGYSYVAWCWNAGGVSVTNSAGTNNASVASTYRANKAAGFSIVTWAGSNAVGTVAHGLGAAPSFIIAKSRTTANAWGVFHQSANGGSGQNGYLLLNGTGTFTSDINAWNNTAPTANVFSVAAGGFNAGNMVAYCFAAVPGFSAFGSYTGNGSADGPFVYTGFRPAWIMIKRSDSVENWNLYDNKRNSYNIADLELYPNLSNSEGTTADRDFLSNGFKIRSTNIGRNASGGTYIYAAFAETPARLSTAR